MKKALFSLILFFTVNASATEIKMKPGTSVDLKVGDVVTVFCEGSSSPRCTMGTTSGFVNVFLDGKFIQAHASVPEALHTISLLKNAGLCN
ncbi:MAG: hypothetical protein AB7F59_08810 [Bdellovibrionales bacterium]